MKRLSFITVAALWACSCTNQPPKEEKIEERIDSVISVPDTFNRAPDIIDTAVRSGNVDSSTDNETVTFYMVIADTGTNYQVLHRKMTGLQQQLHLDIDTLGRGYSKEKQRITLPENDEDEMYAGDYFPRRGAGENLSIEQMDAYLNSSGPKNMGLVAGIYSDQASGDRALKKVKQQEPKAFLLKAGIYMGCMH